MSSDAGSRTCDNDDDDVKLRGERRQLRYIRPIVVCNGSWRCGTCAGDDARMSAIAISRRL